MRRKFVLFFLIASGIGFYFYHNQPEIPQTPTVTDSSVSTNKQHSSTISLRKLPPEAIETLQAIKKGPPFPYTKTEPPLETVKSFYPVNRRILSRIYGKKLRESLIAAHAGLLSAAARRTVLY
jgi:hypothetical protein